MGRVTGCLTNMYMDGWTDAREEQIASDQRKVPEMTATLLLVGGFSSDPELHGSIKQTRKRQISIYLALSPRSSDRSVQH